LGSSLSLFYNLLFKAVKADPVPSRALAVLKRLLAESMHVPSGNAAGGALFLASHVAAAPKRKHLLEALVGDGSAGEADFDTSQRDPLYAVGGESKDAGTSIWETAMLQNHWHPSVSKFAANLMGDGTIDYTGDPLRDFTLAPFLDRLAYKNPKSKEKLKKDFRLGESVAERKSGGRGLAVAGGVAVNDPLYLQQRAPVGEEFFYRFFSAKAETDAKSGKKDVKEVDLEDAEIDQFGDVDTNWDADDSEEEFAQKVAEDMMERHGNGKAHFDDEDVAFDMSSDDDDSVGEGGGEGGGEGESDDDEFGDGPVGEEAGSDDDEEEEEDDDSDDEDAKMLMEDSEDDEVSSDGMEQGGSAFADAPSSSDEEEPVEAEDDSDSDEDDEDDDDDDMGEFPLDSDSEDEAPVKKKGKKGKSDEPTFASSADAFQTDDYWAQRDKEMAAKEKRMLDAIGGPEPSNSGGKKRKSRRKSQKQ
jgi:ribosome biogenesis protein MAK21